MRGWTSRAVPALLLLVAVTACGDSRLKKLSVGIEKDSVAVLMKTDSPHRTPSYLTGGKLWEVQFYTREPAAITDSVAERKMSPVVFAEGKVTGWGWDYWEKQAKTLNIPVPAKE